MIDIQSEELSALLDGELSTARAAHVRAAIAADPALRVEYALLVRSDAALRAVADATAFDPDVAMPAGAAPPAGAWGLVAVALPALVLVRMLPKFSALPALALGLQVAAGLIMLLVTVRLARTREWPEILPSSD